MRARDGFPIAEVAQTLGQSEGSVKVTLYRAKERFRAVYGTDNDTDGYVRVAEFLSS